MKLIRTITNAALICTAAASALAQTGAPNIVVGAGYLYPVPIVVAPGQLITIVAQGVGASLNGPVLAPPGKLPTTLAGITVTFKQGTNLLAPIQQVQPISTCSTVGPGCATLTAITIQAPYELVPVCLLCAAAMIPLDVIVSENGAMGFLTEVTVEADQVHILTACDSVIPGATGYRAGINAPSSYCPPLVTHADGSLVTAGDPASGGEELVAYAVGLGQTNPQAVTGQPAPNAAPLAQDVALDFNYKPNALASRPWPGPVPAQPQGYVTPLFAGLTPGYVGLYQINFTVPDVPVGYPGCALVLNGNSGAVILSNLTVSVGGTDSFDGAGICVAPIAATARAGHTRLH